MRYIMRENLATQRDVQRLQSPWPPVCERPQASVSYQSAVWEVMIRGGRSGPTKIEPHSVYGDTSRGVFPSSAASGR